MTDPDDGRPIAGARFLDRRALRDLALRALAAVVGAVLGLAVLDDNGLLRGAFAAAVLAVLVALVERGGARSPAPGGREGPLVGPRVE